MSTAIAVDFLSEIIDNKNPEVSNLLSMRDSILSDPTLARQSMDALDNWSSSRERQGVLLYLLGYAERALNILETEAGSEWSKHFLARALMAGGFYVRAEEIFAAAFKTKKDFEFGWPLFRSQMAQGKTVEAGKTLKVIKSEDPAIGAGKAEIEYFEGGLSQAMDSIVTLQNEHSGNRYVAFVYAKIAQAAGDDDAARRAYESISQNPPVPTDVLLNLGTLYEDIGEHELAIKCYETILGAFPTHRRAKLYRGDAMASLNMFYDEDRERKEDKRMQILRTPCTDFELSVRSRNCLQKMKIDTLGDLILKTESELLSYKNFGETSLQEIKAILGAKGLRLGMRTDEAMSYLPTEDGSIEAGENDLMAASLDTLELSVRSRRCMDRLGIDTIGVLLEKSETELLAAPNFGQTSLNELRQKLSEMELTLKA